MALAQSARSETFGSVDTCADVLLIKALDHARINLTRKPEPGRCLPGPLPERLPSRGVVGHGTDTPANALPAGEVGNATSCVERRISRHDRLPPLN